MQARGMSAVVKAMAAAGQGDRAVRVARSLPSPDIRSPALVAVTEALIDAGKRGRAAEVAAIAKEAAEDIPYPGPKVKMLTTVAEVLVDAGQVDQATHAVAIAEQVAHNLQYFNGGKVESLSRVAEAMVGIGRLHEASDLATTAEQMANSLSDPHDKATALGAVTRVLAAFVWAHRPGRRSRQFIRDPWQRTEALNTVVDVLLKHGNTTSAGKLPGAQSRLVAFFCRAAQALIVNPYSSEIVARRGEDRIARATAYGVRSRWLRLDCSAEANGHDDPGSMLTVGGSDLEQRHPAVEHTTLSFGNAPKCCTHVP